MNNYYILMEKWPINLKSRKKILVDIYEVGGGDHNIEIEYLILGQKSVCS